MPYRVLVPNEASETVPQAAALLEVRHGQAVVCRLRGESFAENCAQAVRRGRVVAIPAGSTLVGYFDEGDGELRPDPRGLAVLEKWLGKRVYRNDLVARDNRADRRSQARRLLMQGRTVEAFRLDRRGGL